MSSQPTPLTVASLRAALDAYEADWTEGDTRMLGAFEDQPILVEHYDKDDHGYEFIGVGPTVISADFTLGIMILPLQ